MGKDLGALSERPGSREEHASQSGRYRLVTTQLISGAGSWDCSKGVVYGHDSDEPIAVVYRNYSSFDFLFVEGHENGHDYLVCGEDYQGQTVVELDTGRRLDVLSKGAAEGVGFCWAVCSYNAEHRMLVVEGCHWACPYELRFFDFSEPMSGWPEVELERVVWSDRRAPVFHPDGAITCFQSEISEDDDGDGDGDAPGVDTPVAATQSFRREGLRFLFVKEWASDDEQERRRLRGEARQRYAEWLATFRSSDPLYLAMLDELKGKAFSPEDYDGIGQTYTGWCPGFEVNERRMTRRIQKDRPFTLDLEWGAETGPIKLVVYRDGEHIADKVWAEHSAASIRAAFAHARSIMATTAPSSECPESVPRAGQGLQRTP